MDDRAQSTRDTILVFVVFLLLLLTGLVIFGMAEVEPINASATIFL